MSAFLLFDSPADRADAGAFLTRVVRLDPSALARLRRSTRGVELWSWLPLDVLVSRGLAGQVEPADVTVSAAELLTRLEADTASVGLPTSRDAEWRGALPAATGWHRLEDVPSAELQQIVQSAVEAFRAAAASADPGRVGAALLDHESLTVSERDVAVAVPLRVLQALARMGFLRPDGDVVVAVTATWLRVDAAYGSAYRRRGGGLSLTVS